jgi:DNA-binding XRE family transcriptional regulator
MAGTDVNVNNVKKIREERLISKMELARLAEVSPITIGRIERGESCRMETKRKIILALQLTLEDREKVFPDNVST